MAILSTTRFGEVRRIVHTCGCQLETSFCLTGRHHADDDSAIGKLSDEVTKTDNANQTTRRVDNRQSSYMLLIRVSP